MDIEKICTTSWILQIILFIKTLFTIISILVPIGLIVMVSVDIGKNVITGNPENMNKNLMLSMKRIGMAIVVFLVPTIANFAVGLVDDDVSLKLCFANANSDMIATIKEVEKTEKAQEEALRQKVTIGDIDTETPYIESTGNGKGKGRAKKITIENDVVDPEGRCGDSSKYKCQAIATVEYPGATVKYYMQKQMAQSSQGLLGGSCRAHAFTCIMNAIKGTTYSTLDFQRYIETISANTGHKGVLKSEEIKKAIEHYELDATPYYDETSIEECVELIKQALDNGQPIMIFVAHGKCPDLAGSHHALFLLGYDDNGNVLFIDSAGYYKNSNGKRNVEELAQCISQDSVARSYYRMIIFNF